MAAGRRAGHGFPDRSRPRTRVESPSKDTRKSRVRTGLLKRFSMDTAVMGTRLRRSVAGMTSVSRLKAEAVIRSAAASDAALAAKWADIAARNSMNHHQPARAIELAGTVVQTG